MLRKALFLLMVMLTVPNFASAYNYWSITATTSPQQKAPATGNLPGALTPEAGVTTPGSGFVQNVTSNVDHVDFTVGTPVGYTLSYVTVDGIKVGTAAGTYTVNKGTKQSHTIAATYVAKTYDVKLYTAPNGRVSAIGPITYKADGKTVNYYTAKVAAGASMTIQVAPNTGYTESLAGVTSTSGTTLDGTPTHTFTVSDNLTLTPTFTVIPAVKAKISTSPQTLFVGQSLLINGSTSTSTVNPTTFNWSVLTEGATVTATTEDIAENLKAIPPNLLIPAGQAANFVATKPGNYTVKLSVGGAGITTPSETTVVLIVTSKAIADSNACASCHSTRDGAAVAAYNASAHAATENVNCNQCHTTKTVLNNITTVDTMAVPVKVGAAYNVCATCHAATIGEFQASIHWTSPTGHESDADFTAAGHGSVASCAAKCHFNQGASTGCAVCHSGALTTGGVIAASSAHSVKAATVDNTCYVCHSGSKHGWSPRAFEKSSHFAGAHGAGYFGESKCLVCHNSHSTEATFGDGTAAAGCGTCHRPGPYGIMNADGTGKTPHGGGLPSTGSYVDGTQKTQYLSQGAVCADCHAHNNTINKGYAEGGHGHVSDVALNAFTHYDWSGRTNNGTRQNGNCDRCHTAGGFVNFLGNDPATATRLAPQPGIQNVLVCIGCHKALEGEGMENAPLRTDATPAGNPTPLTGGYFALFSSAAPSAAKKQGEVAADKTKIQIAFPGYKNSSICIPCHSGRSTAAVFTAVIDQAKLVNGNYSTVATSYYQHAANMGQTFISQGAYDLNNKLASFPVSAHTGVKMGASDTQGPCVGCHYSKAGLTHSLEVDNASPTCIAAACHATAPDLTVAKAQFDAGVAALDTLIKAKFAPLQTKVGELSEERANVRFGRFGKAEGVAADEVTAKKAYGAWYNWQLLMTYDNAAWAHNPRYARQVLNDTILYLAADGVIPSSSSSQRTLIWNAIAANSADAAAASSATLFVAAPGCAACHTAQAAGFATGFHYVDHKYSCANCHSELHMNTDAALAPTCRCHGDNATSHPVLDSTKAVGATCNNCHTTNNGHSMTAADLTKKCVECHTVAANHDRTNDGVRAIMPEFNKRSHHITGAAPTDAQCAVCHLEGKADATGKTVVDATYHMKDAKVYLRDVDDSTKQFVWDGADHGAMDNFCFNCHDANGANDIATIQAFLPAATKINPFADTLTNSYDMVARAGVVDVKTAFATTNASHHAVIAPKYKYRFSTLANATAWAERTGNPVPDESEIAEGKVVDGETVDFGEESVDNATYFLGHGEAEATLYETGKFVSTYTPLGATEFVADNSQLHCGDCHTVGQWKAGSSTNADGSTTSAVIGAHGSANEYMLRNTLGTDALATPRTLVCFNCHKTTFPSGNATNYNQISGYATAHAVSAFHGQCIADSMVQIGVTNRLNNSERADREATWATADGAASTNAGSGNITGISCTNCHNSGLRQGWGGIHGGDNTYTDGLGRSQKTYRFMPGMGNYRYAPPGGWDGRDHTDASLETVAMSGVGAGKAMGGCYTNSALTGSDPNTGYGACSHHGTNSTEKSQAYMDRIRVVAPNARTQYNGGTASSPTASEPTVREATGGTSLVTRPLKY